ncbi:MAG TPA: hypothetical protein DCY94_03980 [Firmicutes bacterium]|nr:hypothetical protein [Bacillota bacterium]
MKNFSEFICKHKNMVLIISAVLFFLSIIGMNLTKINYDILVYLPEDIETIKGQNILSEDFHMGAFSIASIDNMPAKEILALETEIAKIDGVNEVASLYDLVGTTIPLEMLPEEIVKKVHDGDSDLLMVTFTDSTSADSTIAAVEQIRNLTDERVKFGGMSSMVLDTRDLSSKEIAIYVLIAVALCLLVLELALDSYLVPILLLGNIGLAILFNLGSNVFLGQISYITKALVAVLQLGVTTDFSIFLYHSYDKYRKECKNKEEAMTKAIKDTFASVTGSSLTTIVGFLVLITMQLTLGRDLGIVMAKGVLLGVICVLTLFPSLLLVFDKAIQKTKHKTFIPNFEPLHKFLIKYHKVIFAVFLILLIPAYLANSKVDVYYKIDSSLPETLESITANADLKDKFGIVSPEMILLDKDMTVSEVQNLISDIKQIDGVDFILSTSTLKRYGIDSEIIENKLSDMFETDDYQMLLLNSTYEIASDELNEQVNAIDTIVKKYDQSGIVVGEGPLMKDLIDVSDRDFKNVNTASIICIFFVLFFVLRSLSLPFLLILTIEFAIFLNMGFSYFGGTTLPFVAPIVLGTIQLGATIDYAILITTTYLKNRTKLTKREAMEETLKNSTNSIFISGMCFFAATFGVGLYSDLEMVGSLCTLISRGAIVSMIIVIAVLPSILLIFDKLILKTTLKSRKDDKMKKQTTKKVAASALILMLLMSSMPLPVLALTKEETVYSKTDPTGKTKEIIVNERLINDQKKDTIEDYTELQDILNINDDSPFTKSDSKLTWNTKGKDIFYRGTTKKELPVSLSIDYYMDGKKAKLDEILGKKGNVTISLHYKNLDSHKVNGTTLYTPFTVMIGTVLDSKNISNIKISNGKVSSNGTKNIVVGFALPGLYESLKMSALDGTDTVTISFDTENFELPSIYSIITPELFSEIDTSLLDKMDGLSKNMTELKTNMDKIEEGSHTLKSGSSTLKSTLGSSIASMKIPQNALDEKTLESIKAKSLETVMSTFTDEYKSALGEETWKKVENMLTTEDQKLVEMISSIVNESVTNYLKTTGEYEDYLKCKRAEGMLSQGLTPDAGDLNSCQIIEKDTTLPLIIETSSTAATKAARTASMYTAEKITKIITPMIAEQTAISTAENLSVSLATSVANEVKNASISTISKSLDTLYKGVSTLDDGIKDLDEGITKFNEEGITKLSTTVNGNLEPTVSRLRSVRQLGLNYQSFGSKLDSTKGETKFIMITESKSLPKGEKKVSVQKEKTSLWEKIKNLFN